MTTAAPHPLMTPGEVAQNLHVTPQTVRQWAEAGVLERHLTPTGHGRYRREKVMQLWRVSVPFGSPLMSPRQTREMLDVSEIVLRSWEDQQVLECLVLPTRHRRYVRDQVTALRTALKVGSAEVMTTAQVAERLNMSTSMVSYWIGEGELRPLDLPVRRRGHLFAVADVDAFQRVRATSAGRRSPSSSRVPRPLPDSLMTTSAVAELFDVSPASVQRWGQAGALKRHFTRRGHGYLREEVMKPWDGVSVPPGSRLMCTRQTMRMLRTSDRVLRRWVDQQVLECLFLPTGQRRYVRDQVTDLRAALKGGSGEVMTTAQVAELLGLNPSTLSYRIGEGELRPLDLPVRRREHLFAAADVRAFQRARAESPPASVPA